ncbi:hypothetical protein [Bradyrhizobium sp. CCGUVB23]|uniref:hypothetical protein n=1 Tax=Bradyrhizobium sp. CCGUVB23 TaxID=2949630 RepID=UPI0020B25792|nr:hypothetical protein [Bradyrhizobium sp. CCGUVB23]MCP3461034.1 hypothetical protein [Bradyrhizobium sp. CCGUVB23]
MASHGSLGILELERGLPPDMPRPTPAFGSLRHPATFQRPAIFETVPGAWVENVVRGDPSLEGAYVQSAQRLVSRGAIAISSNCGFSVRHQAAIAAAVNVPVVMSSLLLIPTLLRQLPASAMMAVLTYDSAHLTEDLLDLEEAAQRARIVIGGIEGGEFWHNELKRPVPPTSVASIESDVKACVARLRTAHPEIGAILLECAGFPIVAPTIRRLAKLPVYDIVSLCCTTIAALD